MTTPPIEKACPIVLRFTSASTEILAFRHPLAGLQIVKGTVEPDEAPSTPAIRELAEESGLVTTSCPELLLRTKVLPHANKWHFYICDVAQPIRDTWTFRTQDDGGQDFSFFWHDLAAPLSNEWHPLFVEVLQLITPAIKARV